MSIIPRFLLLFLMFRTWQPGDDPNVGGHLYFTIVQRVTDNHHHPKKVTFSQNCQEVLIKKTGGKKKKLVKKLFLASNWQQFGHKLVNAIHLVDFFRLTEEYIKPLDLFEVHPSEAWWKSTLRISRDPPFWRGFLNLYCRDVFGSSKKRYVLEGSVFLVEWCDIWWIESKISLRFFAEMLSLDHGSIFQNVIIVVYMYYKMI